MRAQITFEVHILELNVLANSPIGVGSNCSFFDFPFIFNTSRMALAIFTEGNLIIFGDFTMKILSDMQVFFGSDITQQYFIAVLKVVG